MQTYLLLSIKILVLFNVPGYISKNSFPFEESLRPFESGRILQAWGRKNASIYSSEVNSIAVEARSGEAYSGNAL